MVDATRYLLGDPETDRPAAGAIADGRVYLPTPTLLHVYNAATWERLLENQGIDWSGPPPPLPTALFDWRP